MNKFFKSLLNAVGLERKTTDVSALTWSELFPEVQSKSGVSVNVETSLRTSTVLACTRVLSEGIAQLPKNLFDVDPELNTKKKNTTHKVYRLLARAPNEWMTSFEFFETMTMHAVLTGNAFAYIGWGGGEIQELIPLVPNQVSMVRKVDWSIDYYVTDLAGVTTTLDQSQVFHLKGPSWNNYQGMDVVQLAREAIGLSIATEQTHASLHANGAQPGGVLAVKGKLDKEARERLKAQWQAFQGGVQNRFKTAVLDVDAEWKPLSMTGVDSQHLETRRFQIEEICRAMRVFPQMVMHTDKTSTFASAEVFFLAHVTHSLEPWVRRWEEAISKYLLADDDNLVCKLNTAAIMRGDASSRANFYQAALGGARGETAYMTRNEVRDLEDLNPIEGGDKLLIPIVTPPPSPPAASDNPAVTKALELIALAMKYNENHDDQGRFTTGGGGSGGAGDHAGRLYSAPTKTADQLIDQHGARDYVNQVEARLALSTPTNAPVASGGHVLPNGEYTPERQAVQDKILHDIFTPAKVAAAMPAPGTQPVLSVLGGRGGSGKSFITQDGGPVSKTQSLLLDSDSIKEMLPGYEGWNAALYHEEAGAVLAKADEIASKLGINVTHDATLKSEGASAIRQQLYKNVGYKVHGYFVHAHPETAVGRALGRARKPGGRYVPPHVILANTDNEKNFDRMKTGFAKWEVYDNNGTGPQLVAKGGNG